MLPNSAHVRNAEEALAHLEAGEHTFLINQNRLGADPNPLNMIRYGIFDFDGSLIAGSQWARIRSILPAGLSEIDAAVYRWYHNHVHDAEPDFEEVPVIDKDWWVGHLHTDNLPVVDGAWVALTVGLMASGRIHRKRLRAQAQREDPREGVRDLFAMLERQAIITFGTEQFPEYWAEHHGLGANLNIAGTRIVYDDEGYVSHIVPNPVGSASKRLAAERWMHLARASQYATMVLGDSVVDASMMLPGTFNVLLVPRSETERKMRKFRENNLGVVWPNVDVILHSDSLMPLVEVLREARHQG